jgi:hypothetical protein
MAHPDGFLSRWVSMIEDRAADGFPTTHWSRVVAAGDRAAPEARQALAELCAAYWYPLYAFVRRNGHGADAALDLTTEAVERREHREPGRRGVPRQEVEVDTAVAGTCGPEGAWRALARAHDVTSTSPIM